MTKSALQIARSQYVPKMPSILQGKVMLIEGEKTQSIADQTEIAKLFPHTYGLPVVTFAAREEKVASPAIHAGIILSGGQAPGGHNVIAGLFDGIKKANKKSRLYGFLMGPDGLIKHQYVELTKDVIDEYRNTGGFDMIGSGRTKLEKRKDFNKGLEVLKKLKISALVIIGGDDSNTNACILAEYYKKKNTGVQVIGCPKTIDGDLKNEQIETSFGFDTACKVYSEMIGNIQRDCNSARKYWHFIKLMGRSASHIALECALQTHPNICIISEEVKAKNKSLNDIVNHIASIVTQRAEKGDRFGTVLIPEGLIEFIPEMGALISELNDFLSIEKNMEELAALEKKDQLAFVSGHISEVNAKLYQSLPDNVAIQLIRDRDPHGNVQVSLIETEKLLADLVASRLKDTKSKKKSKKKSKVKFATQVHFFGYEGRCAAPSNYDADYCYSLGYTASCLINAGKTGYMASVSNTTAPTEHWIAGGIPITMMMNMEQRHGVSKPVIKKALVDLEGLPFKSFEANRDDWALSSDYIYPGPIQYFGPSEVCDQPSLTLKLEHGR